MAHPLTSLIPVTKLSYYLVEECKDQVSKQIFEELIEDEEGYLDTFKNIKDHVDKLGASYLATLAG
jgi:bacterioferritin (cytochrome b1)